MSQENYIKSLQQQIKILELEISYLKKQKEDEEPQRMTATQEETVNARKSSTPGSEEAVKRLKSELQTSILQDLEKSAIISKDRERSIQQLTEDLEGRVEEVTTLTNQVEHLQTEVGGKQTIITQLQEKFMQ